MFYATTTFSHNSCGLYTHAVPNFMFTFTYLQQVFPNLQDERSETLIAAKIAAC